MKSFAILAAVAGAVTAQQSLGSCAQMCYNNMATIAQTEFQCAAGDTSCFCNQSNWAYGLRDCTAQACGAEESIQAVSYANSQCQGVAASGTTLAAIPILTSALATATGAAGSAAASATESAASQASEIIASGSSVLSSALESASSAAASAASSASDALNSITSAAASAASSAAGDASSVASSVAGAASSAASPPPNAAAPLQTGLPVVAGAGLIAMLLL